MTRPTSVRPDHPIDDLAFFLQDPGPDVAASFMTFLAGLRERGWTLAPPVLIDEQEDGSTCRNLGGVLQLYCAHPPWGERLPAEIDAAQFHETRALLGELASLSKDMGPFVVWFDGEEIGDIVDGRMDRSLEEGLLREWERTLRREGGGDE